MNEKQLQAHLVSGEVIVRNYGSYRKPAQRIICADGLNISIQASEQHYCTPRNDEGPYTTVEVGFPSYTVDELIPYAEDSEHPTDTVYAQVPVEVVLQVINSRGGVVLDQ